MSEHSSVPAHCHLPTKPRKGRSTSRGAAAPGKAARRRRGSRRWWWRQRRRSLCDFRSQVCGARSQVRHQQHQRDTAPLPGAPQLKVRASEAGRAAAQRIRQEGFLLSGLSRPARSALLLLHLQMKRPLCLAVDPSTAAPAEGHRLLIAPAPTASLPWWVQRALPRRAQSVFPSSAPR